MQTSQQPSFRRTLIKELLTCLKPELHLTALEWAQSRGEKAGTGERLIAPGAQPHHLHGGGEKKKNTPVVFGVKRMNKTECARTSGQYCQTQTVHQTDSTQGIPFTGAINRESHFEKLPCSMFPGLYPKSDNLLRSNHPQLPVSRAGASTLFLSRATRAL